MELDHLNIEERRSPLVLIISVLSAIAISAAIFFGYMALRRKHATQTASLDAPTQSSKEATPAQLQIFEDDAMLKGSQATLGGTVKNISGNSFTNLSVEIELKRRSDGSKELRSVSVDPKNLGPDGEGKYSFTIQPHDYSNAMLVRVKSGNSSEVAFKTAQGARRPPERVPAQTIIVNRPRSKGDDFLNSPDNPVRVP